MNDKTAPPSVGEFAIGERDHLLARVAELEAGNESLRLVRDDYKRQANEYRALWSKAVVKTQSHALPMPDRDAVIRKAVGLCNRIPGSTNWNAAEYAYDEFIDQLAALKQPSAGVDERSAFEASGLKSSSSVWHEGCYQYKTIDDEGEEYFTAGLGLDNLKWQAWQARAQLSAPAGVPDDKATIEAKKWCDENGATPAEFLGYQLLVKRSDLLGRQLSWAETIEITALVTNMPEAEKQQLLAMDDKPASDVVPVPRELQDEAERCAFVLENIGSLDADDIDGDAIDLRFEDADGRDTGCDVSIVEYAERSAKVIRALLNGGRS